MSSLKKHKKIIMKIFKILLLSIFTVFFISSHSQNMDGEISIEMLKQMKEKCENDKSLKAIQNAVSNNDIKKLALNRDNLSQKDVHFSHKVKTSGITNQKSSGRCWLFTGLNVLKPKVLEKYNIAKFDFSHNYCFFFDQLEKANLFFEGIIETCDKADNDRKVEWLLKNSIGDGGQWTGVVDIVEKYGVVPKEVMPETNSSDNTSMMSRLIKRKLKEFALELRAMSAKGKNENDLRLRKDEMLSVVYKMLVISLGEPPTEFEWRYKDKDGKLSKLKKYTPISFYNEAIGLNLKDYVMLMNDPSREYFKLYEIEYDRHTNNGGNWKYINLPANEIKEFGKKSIMDNEAMYFSCDVGKQLNSTSGWLDINNYDYGTLYNESFGMDKTQRIKTFDSGSSHGMTLIGVDIDKDGKINKWLLENSWGEKKGHKGHLIMTDKWFDEYMFRLVVNKKYISEKVLKILEEEPIMLPPWDPMFANEE